MYVCILALMGYSRKYPPPSLWTTLNWVPRNFRISKKDNSSFCRIPSSAHSKSWGFPEFCKTLNRFLGIPVKIHKIWGKFMDFQSGSPSIYYRTSNDIHHGGRGGGDIFWNSPIKFQLHFTLLNALSPLKFNTLV